MFGSVSVDKRVMKSITFFSTVLRVKVQNACIHSEYLSQISSKKFDGSIWAKYMDEKTFSDNQTSKSVSFCLQASGTGEDSPFRGRRHGESSGDPPTPVPPFSTSLPIKSLSSPSYSNLAK